MGEPPAIDPEPSLVEGTTTSQSTDEKAVQKTSVKPLSLSLKSKKKKKPVRENAENVLGHPEPPKKSQTEAEGPIDAPPLVIPVGPNQLRWKRKQEEDQSAADTPAVGDDAARPALVPSRADDEDARAAEALIKESQARQEEQVLPDGTVSSSGPSLVIRSTGNRNKQLIPKSEKDQYKEELAELPAELGTDADQYEAVPISSFGAAMLRGMGWEGPSETTTASEDTTLPRPHRLGLGATPVLPIPTSNKSGRIQRPDQWKKNQKLQAQQEEYARQRERQVAMDRQATLQIGSIVHLRWGDSGRRATILQLKGVPGLSRIKVQLEGEDVETICKKGDIEALVSRQDLERIPYKEVALRKQVEERRGEKRKESRREEKSRDTSRRDRKRDRGDEDRSSSTKSSKRSRDDKRSSTTWLIPNIRVRVITEKLGRRHYKSKGVVVDVTPVGATLQMPGGTVLDRVPERYLETALPKAGGNVIALTSKHLHAKGQLLERDSSRGVGVMQVFEDMTILTLSLDDLAEWCGPLDDDLGA